MKIAIDISQIVYETGVSVYTQNLVKNLLEIDNQNEYILFGGSGRKLDYLKNFTKNLKGNFKAKFFPTPPILSDFIFNKLHVLSVENLIGKVDVFHSSDWTQPKSSAFKVTTIHDLAPILFPQYTHPRINKVHKRRLAWVKKEVNRIIVPSQSIKNDLTNLGFSKAKIRVISEAVDEIFMPQSKQKIKNLKVKYNIKNDYLLSVGVGGRKNTQRLIEAFNKLDSAYNLQLVLIGNNFEFKNQKNIIFTGHVSKSDLSIFYSGAKALIYPSIYEGFGLPILEAFAMNCPVVTSNTGSLKELANSYAYLCDPESVNSIADAIDKIIKNPQKYTEKAYKKSKEFSWQKTAKETLRIYEEFN